MKIAFTGFPLNRLIGSGPEKKAGAQAGTGMVRDSVGSASYSAIPDKAMVKYLQTVDDIASDLLRIVDNYAQNRGTGDIAGVPDQLPREMKADIPDIFIYFPPLEPGGEEDESGQVIAMGKGLPSYDAGLPELQDEKVVSDLVKTVVRQLSVTDKSIGLESGNIESILVRARFILFTETKNDMPVVSIIRQEASGRSEPLTEDQVPAGDILDVITKIKAFITEQVNAQEANTKPEEPFSANDGPAGFGSDKSPIPAGVQTDSTPSPLKIVKEILSSVVSEFKGDNTAIKNPQGAERVETITARGPAVPGGALSGAIPGVTVRYINPSPPLPGAPAGTDPRALVVDKLAALTELIGNMPEPILSSEGVSEEELAVVRETMRSVHEQVPALVRQALHAATRNYQGAGAAAGQGPFGIDIDENGTLRIDRAVLVGSLAENKEETITFIRDFGTSLQDRFRYDFNPLAGVYVDGRHASGITETGKKDRAGDDGDEQKTRLEERLNKVELLLRSSYELKDLFVQTLSLNRPGALDETDR